jgi:hypothetical protein
MSATVKRHSCNNFFVRQHEPYRWRAIFRDGHTAGLEGDHRHPKHSNQRW